MDTLRRMLLAVLFAGLGGTISELLLTGHTGEFWQLVPVVLLGAAMPMTALLFFRQPFWLVAVMRVWMTAFLAAGATGLLLHYQSNAEFAAELSPGLSGFALLKEAMTRQAPPPLAPGTMIMFGLIGLICCYQIRGTAVRPQGE